MDVRLALSKDDLTIYGIPSDLVISAILPAVSITNCSLSITQGPAIKNGRFPAPTVNDPIWTSCIIIFCFHFPEMLKPVFQRGPRRVETGGVPSGYVEDFDELRTKLETGFSISC